jgi:hypothetical protein
VGRPRDRAAQASERRPGSAGERSRGRKCARPAGNRIADASAPLLARRAAESQSRRLLAARRTRQHPLGPSAAVSAPSEGLVRVGPGVAVPLRWLGSAGFLSPRLGVALTAARVPCRVTSGFRPSYVANTHVALGGLAQLRRHAMVMNLAWVLREDRRFVLGQLGRSRRRGRPVAFGPWRPASSGCAIRAICRSAG